MRSAARSYARVLNEFSPLSCRYTLMSFSAFTTVLLSTGVMPLS